MNKTIEVVGEGIVMVSTNEYNYLFYRKNRA